MNHRSLVLPLLRTASLRLDEQIFIAGFGPGKAQPDVVAKPRPATRSGPERTEWGRSPARRWGTVRPASAVPAGLSQRGGPPSDPGAPCYFMTSVQRCTKAGK